MSVFFATLVLVSTLYFFIALIYPPLVKASRIKGMRNGLLAFLTFLFMFGLTLEEALEETSEIITPKVLTVETKQQKIAKLLQAIPNTNSNIPSEKREIYKKLVELAPNDESFQIGLKNYTKKAKIKVQFSAWSGSHRRLEKVIKSAMNDPDSYKHVKTTYVENDDYILVKTTYRGKNGFNATITESVMVKVDIDGNLLEIVDQ